ncbi:MAG: hypothetical protein KatS3mg040_0332 [Candidatus Kapaibacterium sp.]|nr:MAG: hypothetical protein KatS3mg040_0332 [Candidatus Kapabacteria bacterium]
MHTWLRNLVWVMLLVAALALGWRVVLRFSTNASNHSTVLAGDSVSHVARPPQPEHHQQRAQPDTASVATSTLSSPAPPITALIRPTVDVFVLSPPSFPYRKLRGYIESLNRSDAILRIHRSDTIIIDTLARISPLLDRWILTAPTVQTSSYSALLKPLEQYCTASVPIHAIIVGTMRTTTTPIADLRCLRGHPSVTFVLALQRNEAYTVWKATLKDLAIPFHTLP